MAEMYLWMIRLRRYAEDGYDAEWLSADPAEAEIYEREESHKVTIMSFEEVADVP